MAGGQPPRARHARPRTLLAGAVLLAASLVATTGAGAPATVHVPLVCSRGSNGGSYDAVVTVPFSAPTGSTYTVRIEALPSPKISHTGLHYIYDWQADWLLPQGAEYVEGSAHVVPNTGSQNVRDTARVWHDTRGVHLILPGHVQNGGSYTPPVVEFKLKALATAGKVLEVKLDRTQVKANVFLLGDLTTTCDPAPRPRTIGMTGVVAP